MSTWTEFVTVASENCGQPALEECQENVHWRDPSLAYTVYVDMCNSDNYRHVRGACFPLTVNSDYRVWIVRAQRLDASSAPSCLSAVISVSAGVGVEPGQLAEAASRAKKWLESSRSVDEVDLPIKVMIAFCDGSHIIYYNAFDGISHPEVPEEISACCLTTLTC